MTDTDIRNDYLRQRAPEQELPRALQAFAEHQENAVRPRFLVPALVGAAVFALAFGVAEYNSVGELPVVSQQYSSTSPVLAQLRTPVRPTMPTLASLSLPAGSIAIPRLNQITTNPINAEDTR